MDTSLSSFVSGSLRPAVMRLAFLAASCCLIASCAGESPIAKVSAPSPPFPSTQPDASVAGMSSAESVREARERYVMRALLPHQPAGVEGMMLSGTGTGFFIANDRVLTNFHVVRGCRGMTVGNNTEGDEVDAKLIANDPVADLAVLAAEAKDIQPARLLTGSFDESQEDLAIVGYPEHGLPVLQAEMDRVAVFEDDLKSYGSRYRFFGPVRRGNSGSPLLDNSGAVVGVVTAKIDTVSVYRKTGEVVDDVGFAISNHAVFNFLTTNRIAFEPARPQARLSSDALLQKAHGFVRQVRCWK